MEMIWAATMSGSVAGLVHVLSGPDHLAAVAPLAAGKGTRCWRVGLEWAAGHSGGVLLTGLLALFLRELVPLELISLSAERLVGVLLIGVAAWGICKLLSGEVKEPPRAAFAIGAIHGLAGGSHLLGVAPALLFPAPLAACAYFTGFGVGTIVAMAGFSSLFGVVPQRFCRVCMVLCSGAAFAIGCCWLTS